MSEYKVLKEILTPFFRKLHQYTYTTLDLGVDMKEMPILWDKPDYYKTHIILIESVLCR